MLHGCTARGLGVLLAMLVLIPTASPAKIVGKEVVYSAGGTSLKGFLAYDDARQGKRPGVLVVHEWWGNNEYSRTRARMLAELGYTALAIDMYGEGRTAPSPDSAGKLAGQVMQDPAAAQARFKAAYDYLCAQNRTDPRNVAAIGYCFGGAVVLNMARAGVELSGVVSFHGNLATQHPAQAGRVKTRVLVCNGAADGFVPKDQISQFKKEMTDAGARFQFIDYPDAKHSFTNPQSTEVGKKFGLDIAYNKKADQKSWQDMKKFFQEIFGSI
jgi:dienelactone hydrolase